MAKQKRAARPMNNYSSLRNATAQRWAMEWSEGEGLENYQVVLGAISALSIAVLLYLLFGNLIVAVPFGAFLGLVIARLPNYLNVHHKLPKEYLRDEVKRRTQRRKLIVNDVRMPEKPQIREDYAIPLIVQPDHKEPESHDSDA